jgi:hypothetical protein
MKSLPSGQIELVLRAIWEDRAEAYQLLDTPGMLLDITVTPAAG